MGNLYKKGSGYAGIMVTRPETLRYSPHAAACRCVSCSWRAAAEWARGAVCVDTGNTNATHRLGRNRRRRGGGGAQLALGQAQKARPGLDRQGAILHA